MRGAVDDGYARVIRVGDDPSLTAAGAGAASGEASADAIAAAVTEIEAQRDRPGADGGQRHG